ncbi:MAG: phosphoglycerate dehydrogenase [Acidimicrobiales bacterium]
MFKVLISDKLGDDGVAVLNDAEDVSVDVRTGLSEQELIDTIGDYDALVIRSGTQVTGPILQAGSGKLKVVGRAGVGIDNVDVDEATRQGVIVMNTPDANTTATAEHTFALLMAAARNIVPAHVSMAAGTWERSSFTGTELKGKTLGVVGFGRVGRAVAVRAQAFEMTVIAYDPFVSERVGRDSKVELLDLEELLAASDFVTLHTALSEETQDLINAERLELMKPGAVLINCARGGLVDPAAVAAALDAEKLAMAAIDVYAVEPPEADHPLVGHPKVIHTPHLGASTKEAQKSVAIEIADQVLMALRGDKIANSVNLAFAPGLDFARINPFISLAAKIGRLQNAMADGPIEQVELELYADDAEDLMRPVAAGLLKGILDASMPDSVNFVNAPVLARDNGLKISRSVGLGTGDYRNQITCRVSWGDGERTVSGVVFSDDHPRIVQVSNYRLEADPTGTVLLMLNDDVPGVIGEVGGVLGDFGINIAEWRLGRNADRTQALSFINLDSHPEEAVLDRLSGLEAVVKAVVVAL